MNLRKKFSGQMQCSVHVPNTSLRKFKLLMTFWTFVKWKDYENSSNIFHHVMHHYLAADDTVFVNLWHLPSFASPAPDTLPSRPSHYPPVWWRCQSRHHREHHLRHFISFIIILYFLSTLQWFILKFKHKALDNFWWWTSRPRQNI